MDINVLSMPSSLGHDVQRCGGDAESFGESLADV